VLLEPPSGTALRTAAPVLRTTVPSPSELPPISRRISAITVVSVTRGTLCSVSLRVVRSEAAISGSAAFFDPLTHTSPASCAPPLIRSALSRPFIKG